MDETDVRRTLALDVDRALWRARQEGVGIAVIREAVLARSERFRLDVRNGQVSQVPVGGVARAWTATPSAMVGFVVSTEVGGGVDRAATLYDALDDAFWRARRNGLPLGLITETACHRANRFWFQAGELGADRPLTFEESGPFDVGGRPEGWR